MKEILIATSNAHKVEEFKEMLVPAGYTVKSLLDFEREFDIEETGKTFAENSIIKSETISKILNMPVIADDSGLEIDALGKQPGVMSARFMGHDTPYSVKNKALIEAVKDKTDRTCRFVCAISLAVPQKETVVFEGSVEGTVAYQIEGEGGFGYDPIFYYAPYGTTLGNVSAEMKNAVSHRFRALEKLMDYLKENEHE